jgi:hypothetical protein
LSFASSEGGTPAQIQALFAQISKEYNVVRRYRNPIADATARAREMPHTGKVGGKKVEGTVSSRAQAAKQKAHQNGVAANGHSSSPEQNLRINGPGRTSTNLKNGTDKRQATMKKEEQKGHKSRVSFDLPSVKTQESDDEDAGGGRGRNEAYEICRRLWEIGDGEVAG